MAKALDVPLYEFTSDYPRLVKYPLLAARTIGLIVRKKIKILFVQNPSIVLSLLAVCLKPFFALTVIVDAHNSGIYPLEGKYPALNYLAKFIARNANFIIVTNTYLADLVRAWGAEPLVIPDPMPSLHAVQSPTKPLHPYIFFICTWASDEPYAEVITAAGLIDSNIEIYITGKYQNKLSEEEIKQLPKNVKLLGFVPEQEYIDIFSGAIAALDLTTRDNCLVCGAYEAMALKIPCIISDTRVNREVFSSGYVYVENTVNGIAEGIKYAISNAAILQTKIAERGVIHQKTTNQNLEPLRMILNPKASI